MCLYTSKISVCSKKVNYLLRKYDVFVRTYDVFVFVVFFYKSDVLTALAHPLRTAPTRAPSRGVSANPLSAQRAATATQTLM